MVNPTKLLLITNDPSMEHVVRQLLNKSNLMADIDEVNNETSALEALKSENYDCAVLEYPLSNLNGLTVLLEAEKMAVKSPIIVTTGQGNESLAVQIMKAGAIDYIPKDKLAENLVHSIQNALRVRTAEIKARDANELCLRLGRILDETSNVIYLFNAMTYGLLQVNLGACQNLGYTKAEMSDMSFLDITPHLSWESFESLTQPLRQGKTDRIRLETLFRRKDGSFYPVEILLQLSQIENSPIFVAIAQDITERIKIAEKLKSFSDELRRSNKELEEFAAIASHDLGEPLRKIISFGDLLKDRYANILDEQGTDYLERMQRAASRMQCFTNDLLLYSKVTTKIRPYSSTNLNQIIEEVSCDLEVRISLSGAKIFAGTIPPIEADKLQMHQLFLNLIGNALKFHKKDQPPVININCAPLDKDFYEISIEDNGIGFNEKYLSRIFKPFERLHGRSMYEGSGMGLAICQKIVAKHGGKIEAQSLPAKGSTFKITLPRKQSKKDETSHLNEKQNNETLNLVFNPTSKNSVIPIESHPS